MDYCGFLQNLSGPAYASGIARSGGRALELTLSWAALPLVVVLFGPCVLAQDPPGRPKEDHALSYGVETDFSSGYVWRGLLVNDGPAMQPSAWIYRSGLTFSAWSNFPLARTSDSA